MILAFAFQAYATLAAESLDPADLAVLSDATAFGDVVDVRSVYTGTFIWTVATLDLVDTNEFAEVWIPGGCVDELCLTISGAPSVVLGERVFVFLRDHRPASLGQGLFHVTGQDAVRDVSGLSFLDGERPATSFALAELRDLAPRVRTSRE
ncbi:MAG: hypothetical protein EXR71_00820 [Myxococcales bacterium]|nr:hypothetical protein [Myxococcales bacterium]